MIARGQGQRGFGCQGAGLARVLPPQHSAELLDGRLAADQKVPKRPWRVSPNPVSQDDRYKNRIYFESRCNAARLDGRDMAH